MPTITGVAGSTINAQCSVAADHAEINQTESSATAQSIVNDLATISTGSCTIAGTKTFSGVLYTSSRRRRSPRVSLTDADHTVAYAAGSGVTDVGTRFVLADPTPTRVITLKSTTVVPDADEVYDFIFPATVVSGTASKWTFQREDASTIATFVTNSAAGGGRAHFWAEFEFRGGVWRLAGNSGMWTDLGGGADYGVVPGASM